MMDGRLGDRHFQGIPTQAGCSIVREVDTRGTYCPGALHEVIRLVRESAVGDTIAVIAREPSAAGSIAAWVSRAGHTLAGIEDLEDGRRYLVTRDR